LLAAIAGAVIPLAYMKLAAAVILVGFGVYCLFRQRHPRGGGMRVGFADLTIWSFLMASAHGAGFMVLPVLLGFSVNAAHGGHGGPASPTTALTATVVHTIGYLAVTGIVAWLVYWKLGLKLLRKTWVNLHLIWAGALILSGVLTLVL